PLGTLEHDGVIWCSRAIGAVSGGDNSIMGGLVGDNAGHVGRSWASGDVSSDGVNVTLGGLVGLNAIGGGIWKSHASGAVTGGDSSSAGGLVGENDGTIWKSHAGGAVTGGDNSKLGGLLGDNAGRIGRPRARRGDTPHR